MALPSSGQLTFSAIATELGITGYATNGVDLRGMSSDAGFGVPDNISEFYGYAATLDNILGITAGTLTNKGGVGHGLIINQGSQSTAMNSDGWGVAPTCTQAAYQENGDQYTLRLTSGSNMDTTWWSQVRITAYMQSAVTLYRTGALTSPSASSQDAIWTWSGPSSTPGILAQGVVSTWTFTE